MATIVYCSPRELALEIVDILQENPEGRTLRQLSIELNIERSGVRGISTQAGRTLDNAIIHLKRKGALLITKIPGIVRGGQNLYQLQEEYIQQLIAPVPVTLTMLSTDDPAYSMLSLLTQWKPIAPELTTEVIQRQQWYNEEGVCV